LFTKVTKGSGENEVVTSKEKETLEHNDDIVIKLINNSKEKSKKREKNPTNVQPSLDP